MTTRVQTRYVDQTGPTVEEAVRLAVQRLGVSRSEVTVDVLREGRPGLFGLRGARSALVRVRVRDAG